MNIINSEGIAYHQHEVLYIIKPQENPAPKGLMRYKVGSPTLMIYAALRASMIYQACGLDKKIRKLLLSDFFGGATRNRTGDKGFADPCLTAWPWRLIKLTNADANESHPHCSGADYGARTRHLRLGKATLYQMS